LNEQERLKNEMLEELQMYWKKEIDFNNLAENFEENEEKLKQMQQSISQLEQDNLRVMK
jgi:hypothetical protein